MSAGASAPDCTVLMPTLNSARYVGDALASIAACDDRERWHVLVLDGGSRDATAEIVRRFAPLAELRVARDDGLYDALDAGLGQVRSGYVAWLNSDDTFAPAGPAALLRALDQDAALDLAYGDWIERRADGSERRVQQHDAALELVRAGDVERGWVAPLSCIWRRDALARLGGWSRRYRIVGDFELWMRAAVVEPPLRARHVAELIATFRQHDSSLSAGKRHRRACADEDIRLAEELVAGDGLPPPLAGALTARRQRAIEQAAWSELRGGHPLAARQLLRHHRADEGLLQLACRQLLAGARRRLFGIHRAQGTNE
ncbi:MAG TPA: glycosyltransferase [Polyangia bacterium]|jgi:hypothetical protein